MTNTIVKVVAYMEPGSSDPEMYAEIYRAELKYPKKPNEVVKIVSGDGALNREFGPDPDVRAVVGVESVRRVFRYVEAKPHKIREI